MAFYRSVVSYGRSVTIRSEQLDKYAGLLKVDIVFAMDLTGSMYDERDEMEASANYIMTTLQAQINDVAFGLISFGDYSDNYSTTEPGSVPETYTAIYGSNITDYAYNLDLDITDNTAAVAAAIAALPYLAGYDFPEDYTRIIHEAWNDSNLHWREGAERFLILFGDDVPHDTNFDCYYNDGTFDNTGGDPGRDEVLGTGDDLDFETEVANAAAANVSIMAVFSGDSYKRYAWEYMAAQTDGQYFPLANASDIPETVYQIIKAEAKATPLEVELYEDVNFPMVIEISNPYDWDMAEVVIKDNFGGDLELLYVNDEEVTVEGKKGTQDILVDSGPVYLLTTGKTEKVHMTWGIGELESGNYTRLFLDLSTDLNPGQKDKGPDGKNEYTSSGEHELNSGVTIKFVDPDGTQLSAHTGSIMVTVVGEETD